MAFSLPINWILIQIHRVDINETIYKSNTIFRFDWPLLVNRQVGKSEIWAAHEKQIGAAGRADTTTPHQKSINNIYISIMLRISLFFAACGWQSVVCVSACMYDRIRYSHILINKNDICDWQVSQ